MNFRDILRQYREQSSGKVDVGKRFERLMQRYLKTDPLYAERFQEIWLWEEFPFRAQFGGSDTGIDLVAKTGTGDYWAVQCKCYQETAVIDKKGVDSFLATSGKKFFPGEKEETGFARRLWISTTNRWNKQAEAVIQNQNPPVSRINLSYLDKAPIDWTKLDEGRFGTSSREAKKKLREHQEEARDKVHEEFKTRERGKLIMACGTGKTLTALRIAEKETKGRGLVLFLVPSIALVGQTLREWSADAEKEIYPICICSDPKVSKSKRKSDSGDRHVVDLALPAGTDKEKILEQFRRNTSENITVVFSTYQSIDVVIEVQKSLGDRGVFDLIICDESHRTTGVTPEGEKESSFVKVHKNEYLRARRRLYMTATPRLYSDDSKSKAAYRGAELCSMDDEALYGREIYRIGFAEAVERELLSDYKVLILTMDDRRIPSGIRKILEENGEINTDDASKIIGCIHALSKRMLIGYDDIRKTDPHPMKRAVAFCGSIKGSKKITDDFNELGARYQEILSPETGEKILSPDCRHVDGTMSAPVRDECLNWLKEEEEGNCRILSNVRCLSEGVDVPSLDGVMFLSAKNSQIDVVQSVGRVMRRSAGKNYGYIVIPVVVPFDADPEKALNDNKRYKVVWTVLNALRAHDDRFNAVVNQIDLNKKKPDNIYIGGPDNFGDEGGEDSEAREPGAPYGASQLNLPFQNLKEALYARMVLKVGDRLYWENWAKDIAVIAERHRERIAVFLESADHRGVFGKFLKGLQKTINPSIHKEQAIEMLAQHAVTKPVFEALFKDASFVKQNPVSRAMQRILNLLEAGGLEKEPADLEKFYDSVRRRVEGIDNARGRQKVITELYNNFFGKAFPKMAGQLGIVYTPLEAVDFILHSVDGVLKEEFGRRLSEENIHILDPFTGMGTFLVRLLETGLVSPEDLKRKYRKELHANEMVLLAYYLAAVNIENAYHQRRGEESPYEAFEGICLTDTFQPGEDSVLLAEMFPQNSKRTERQKKAPLRVILGNPPYSAGQKSANDNAQNQAYPRLDARIAETYAGASVATNSRFLYDSYIKAFRWGTDRLDDQEGGILCFISNGSWLDGIGADGFRKHLEKDFDRIYVLNLRGNQRTSGELSRREGGKIFGSGSRAPISINLLVKNPKSSRKKALIRYHDIGDYLSREEKLKKLEDFQSVLNPALAWRILESNAEGDWINQGSTLFHSLSDLTPQKKYDRTCRSFFLTYHPGVVTSRDSWVYNFSLLKLQENMKRMIRFYSDQAEGYRERKKEKQNLTPEEFIEDDPRKISWSRALKRDLGQEKNHAYCPEALRVGCYRPFMKQHLYFSGEFNESISQFHKLFPTEEAENRVICVSGKGGTKEFSVLMTDCIPDFQVQFNTQCFPLYFYEPAKDEALQKTLLGGNPSASRRRDGISDFMWERALRQYGLEKKSLSKEDLFYFVYGYLHSPDYRRAFSNDLKKSLPRLNLPEDVRVFRDFSRAGRKLADLHVGYETVPPAPGVRVEGGESGFFTVEKMHFPSKGEKTRILFNSRISLSEIPLKAYDYVVNGKPAIEWVMERYRVMTDKASGIVNDPNDRAEESGNPAYILDLLLSVIHLSVQTVEIVASLPELSFNEKEVSSDS